MVGMCHLDVTRSQSDTFPSLVHARTHTHVCTRTHVLSLCHTRGTDLLRCVWCRVTACSVQVCYFPQVDLRLCPPLLPERRKQRLRESLDGCEHLKEVDTNLCPASKSHLKPFSMEGRQGEYGCYLGSDGASVQGLLSPDGSLQEGWMEEVRVLGTPDLGSVCGMSADAGAGVPCFPKSCCWIIPLHCGLVSLSEL